MLGTRTPDIDERIPFNHFKIDHDADFSEILLNKFIHRQRLHLSRSGSRNQDFCFERLIGAIACFSHQLLGCCHIMAEFEIGRSKPLMTGREKAFCRYHHATEQLFQTLTVNREIGSFADADIIPGRTFNPRQMPGPIMRIGIRDNVEARLFEGWYCIGAWRFNPIHLSRPQGSHTRIGFRQRDQNHFVELRYARLVPIVCIGDHFDTFAGYKIGYFPRARS